MRRWHNAHGRCYIGRRLLSHTQLLEQGFLSNPKTSLFDMGHILFWGTFAVPSFGGVGTSRAALLQRSRSPFAASHKRKHTIVSKRRRNFAHSRALFAEARFVLLRCYCSNLIAVQIYRYSVIAYATLSISARVAALPLFLLPPTTPRSTSQSSSRCTKRGRRTHVGRWRMRTFPHTASRSVRASCLRRWYNAHGQLLLLRSRRHTEVTASFGYAFPVLQ